MMAEATGDRREAGRRVRDQRSSSASPAPSRSARTRPRCCRTSRPAARPRWTRWSAPSPNSAASPTRPPRHRRHLRQRQAAGEDVTSRFVGAVLEPPGCPPPVGPRRVPAVTATRGARFGTTYEPISHLVQDHGGHDASRASRLHYAGDTRRGVRCSSQRREKRPSSPSTVPPTVVQTAAATATAPAPTPTTPTTSITPAV